ncbi:hypothetical protein N0V90_000837 [Kalmusia sp. IMI 367209]|nr:hypothetical protein N0V90_000837 [Kalmusia sp. IMI 367209]
MSGDTSSFFGLPLELRELIYKDVLVDPSQGPQILRTCREIHSEAHKFLYQRPIAFQSQSTLYQWLENKPQELLSNVQDFLLELQDVDLTPVLVSKPSIDQPERSRSLRTWELYDEELEGLDRAFGRLPSIKALTIRALAGQQTHLYDEFLGKVLQMLGSHYAALQDLSLEGNLQNQSLTFMRSLKTLTAFTFDGFSASEAIETAAILSSLNLTRISIVSQRTLSATHRQHSNLGSKSQSFDGAVLRTVSHLASFSVSERIPTSSAALFFTPEILNSLHNHETLRCLSLCLSQAPDEEMLDTLHDLLKKNRCIETLELDWPHLQVGILYILTDQLRSLWIRASSLTASATIIGAILESKEDGGLQQLGRVVLLRNGWDADGMVEELDSEDDDEDEPLEDAEDDSYYLDEVDFVSAKRALNELGVEVAWHTETNQPKYYFLAV